ncbi:hypothetical protein GGR52DRAFT_182175 [Hypoxylon sp. FL1284]|nr:hypothetical protein GGR52DRAFT_182175 [Hypoxylon sp. FL1284]
MMSPHSLETVRVLGIPDGTSKQALEHLFLSINTSTNGPSTEARPPVISVASQSGTQTATVTFSSKEAKKKALRYRINQYLWDWNIDDRFNGITVLDSDPAPVLDTSSIVAVHGLNGNAFDTFACDGRMWLRDFLPSDPQLKRTRTMTFGYNSSASDSKNNEAVREWASALLREVDLVRKSAAEKSRPIIFVCHSLGGIVAREAMIRLGRETQRYDGIDLKHCGLLFLATPHSGSQMADWDANLVQVAELVGIRGTVFSNALKSFNSGSMVAKEDFGLLNPLPPYECLYETRKTKVGVRMRTIVEADSAGLDAVKAQPMVDVDHRQICRFKHSTNPGYKQIVGCLKRIQDRIVMASNSKDYDIPRQVVPSQNNMDDNLYSGMVSPRRCVGSVPNVRQTSTGVGMQSGHGTGGEIRRSENALIIGGGCATGATMSIEHLKNFNGVIKGGTGLGARIV